MSRLMTMRTWGRASACLVAAWAASGANGQGQTPQDLMELTNPDAATWVLVMTEDGRRGYVVGERFRLRIAVSHECYLTVLERDPDGEVYLLAPSAATKKATGSDEVRLGPGQSLVLPGGEAAFKAQPPHGASLIKVIMTSKPLNVSELKARADGQPARLGKMGSPALRELSAKVAKAIGVDAETGPLEGRNWATDEMTIITGSDKADLERRTGEPGPGASPPPPAPSEGLPRSHSTKPALVPMTDPDPNTAYKQSWDGALRQSSASKAIGMKMEEAPSVFKRRVQMDTAVSELLVVRKAPRGAKGGPGSGYTTQKVAAAPGGAKAIGDEAIRRRIAELKAGDPTIVAVIPDLTVWALGEEVSFNAFQWHLNNRENRGHDIDWVNESLALIQVPQVLVGVVDQGMNLDEERLEDKIWTNDGETPDNGADDDGNGFVDDVHGFNLVTGSPVLSGSEPFNHGTYCGSIIIGGAALKPGNFQPVAFNARIVPAVCMSWDEAKGTASGSLQSTLEAIKYAADCGAKVINLSLGGPATKAALEEWNSHPLFDELEQKGVLLVIAAGNENSDNDENLVVPGNMTRPNVITVMATDPAGLPARGWNEETSAWEQYTNWGRTTVHIAAPGTMIVGIPGTGRTMYGDGTSFAAPVVAAAAAILYGMHPEWDYQLVRRAILETARPVQGLEGMCTTGGMLDLSAAMHWKPG